VALRLRLNSPFTCRKAPPNNETQRSKHGSDGGSLLISVFCASTRIATRTVLLLTFALSNGLSVEGSSKSVPVRFPGGTREAVAPGGRFAAVWIPVDQTPQRGHLLLLKDLRSDGYRLLRSFGRRVDLSWSRDGRWLAVADGLGSDGTSSWVYGVADSTLPISVWQLLEQQHGRKALAFTEGADHFYVEADRWTDDATLSVRLWGYGGAKSFDRRMQIRVAQ
jgi:hypothetical protein